MQSPCRFAWGAVPARHACGDGAAVEASSSPPVSGANRRVEMEGACGPPLRVAERISAWTRTEDVHELPRRADPIRDGRDSPLRRRRWAGCRTVGAAIGAAGMAADAGRRGPSGGVATRRMRIQAAARDAAAWPLGPIDRSLGEPSDGAPRSHARASLARRRERSAPGGLTALQGFRACRIASTSPGTPMPTGLRRTSIYARTGPSDGSFEGGRGSAPRSSGPMQHEARAAARCPRRVPRGTSPCPKRLLGPRSPGDDGGPMPPPAACRSRSPPSPRRRSAW